MIIPEKEVLWLELREIYKGAKFAAQWFEEDWLEFLEECERDHLDPHARCESLLEEQGDF